MFKFIKLEEENIKRYYYFSASFYYTVLALSVILGSLKYLLN